MKKILLILSFLSIAFAASVAAYTPEIGNMNPFAYDLKSTYDEANMTLSFEFKVNAPAKSIRVYAKDSQDRTYLLDEQTTATNRAITYSVENINLRDKGLPVGEDFTWYVDVEGTSHDKALFVNNDIKLSRPTSIDIDNNYENENFGVILVVEALNDGEGQNGYLSKVDGAGLYALDANAVPRPIPGYPNRNGYNGGSGGVSKNPVDFTSGKDAFSPYRVRVSDDGRIFVSSLTNDGRVLWEVDKRVFSRPNDPYWGNYTGWSKVMALDNSSTYSHTATEDIGNLYTSSSGGSFIAGPNMGFDVRGAGDQLKLLMLSGSHYGIVYTALRCFRCDEYDLGRNVMWQAAPSRTIFKGDFVWNYQGVQVEYDEKGDIYMCQHRAGDNGESLLKFPHSSPANYSRIDNPLQTYRRCGAIRFNKDFSKVIITTKGAGANDFGGYATLYPVGDDGNPIWNQGTEIKMVDRTGVSHMDFAWDYADNLYVACDGDGGHCVAIYAMPNNGEKNRVTTPAASKYAFSTKYSVIWKNLFLNEQDIADAVSPYPDVNIRLWRLLQVEYNEYRLADKDVVYNGENELDQSNFTEKKTENGKNLLNVANYFRRDDSSTRLGRFLRVDTDYGWLDDYISDIAGIELNTIDRSTKYTEDFINRQGYFTEKGQPESWRPKWVEKIFALESKIGPDEYLPVHCAWREANCFTQIWISGWNTDDIAPNDPLPSNTSRPALWYKFNSVRNRRSEGLSDNTHILAWRKDSPTGPIVYHADKPNMELYATYVEKNIDENNPQGDPAKFDATNDELFQLLNNPRYVPDNPSAAPTHDLTVTRYLAAGMYNTICLPLSNDQSAEKNLDLTKLDTEHPLYSNGNGSGATVLKFTGVTHTTNAAGEDITVLNFTQVTEMEAGKPYLVKLRDGAEDYTEKMPFTTVSVHADEYHPVEYDDITFVPTINPTTIQAGSIILVADNRLALTTEEGQMAGLRGYFTVAPAQAKEIAEQAADGRVVFSVKRPLSTSVVVAPESEKQNAPKVQKLLHDGQIYIIRDNQTYTITGVRVK